MSDADRAARGGRDRRGPGVLAPAQRAWATRAEELERLGMSMLRAAAKKPGVKSRANGQQMSAKLRAGLQLLEAADALWGRLHRVGAPSPPEGGGRDEPPARKPRSLADYRRDGPGPGG